MSIAASTFQLGPSILKADGAHPAPDTWRDALLKALDSKSGDAFASTGTAAQSWRISEWPGDARLTIRVQASSAEWPEQVLRRLTRARKQLEKRGSKSVTLALVQKGLMDKGDTGSVQTALLAMGSGLALPNLTLSLKFQHLTPQILKYVGAAFSALQSLHLDSPYISEDEEMQLPPPSVFPDLKHLSIGRIPENSLEELQLSLKPYLPQLVTLIIADQLADKAWPEAHILFTPASTTHTLRSLTLPCSLTPAIAATLQAHAPALETLTVAGVSRGGDGAQPALRACTWQTLRLTSRQTLLGAALEWLPLPASGKLALHLAPEQPFELRPPLSDLVGQKLPGIEVRDCSTLSVRAAAAADDPLAAAAAVSAQPRQLRDALLQLQPIQLSCPQLELLLQGLTVTPAMTAELHTLAASGWGKVSLHTPNLPRDDRAPPVALPPLHTLQLKTTLTDTLLAQLQQRLTSVQVLQVQGVALASALPAGARLPWRVIRVVGFCELADWVRQAELVGDGVELEVNLLNVRLTPEQVAASADLPARLAKTRLTKVNTLLLSRNWDLATQADETGVFLHGLAIAKALPCSADDLALHNWSASDAFVATLTRLPHWKGTLSLCLISAKGVNLDGPQLHPWPMARAPWLIPRSYSVWKIENEYHACLSGPELEAFLYNAPGDRTGEEPLLIRVDGPWADEEWALPFRARLAQMDTCPHVTVTSG